MIFLLTVIGPYVLYRSRESAHLFDSHRAAYRYLLHNDTRKIAGSDRCLSGLYYVSTSYEE